MEGALQFEREQTPKPYAAAAETFKTQLSIFESRKGDETFREPADAIYAFAEFIRTNSEDILKHVREIQTGAPENQEKEYRLEQSTAKLHEFNLANAAVLHEYAELLGSYPESVESLVSIFPWLRDISVWAEAYVQKTATS